VGEQHVRLERLDRIAHAPDLPHALPKEETNR